MKKSEIKQLLNRQLDECTPEMSDDVRRAPINLDGDEAPQDKYVEKKAKKIAKFKWVAAAALLVVVVLIILPWGRIFGLAPSGNDGSSQTVCYIVDINPSIVITVDTLGKVKHISSQNEEGDIVLSSFNNYVDMNVSNCVNAIIEQCAKLGYIDCNSKDNKVTLTLVGDDRNNFIKIDDIAGDAQKFLRKLNVYAVVETAVEDVKTFVQSKGWNYTSSNMGDYMEQIGLQSKYVIGSDFEGDFMLEAEKCLEDYFNKSIVNKNTLLKRLSESLDKLEAADDMNMSYWAYKKVQGTFLEPTLSQSTLELIEICDMYVESFFALGIDMSSSAQFAYYVAKYSILEDLKEFFDSAKNYIYDSEFFDLFLTFVDEWDRQKFETLQDQINDYYNKVVVQLNEQYNERMDKYYSIFQNRRGISDKDYEEYLNSRA